VTLTRDKFGRGTLVGNDGRADMCAEHHFRSVRVMDGAVLVNSRHCIARIGSSCDPELAVFGSLYTSNCDAFCAGRML